MPSKIADFYRRVLDTSPDNARGAVALLDLGSALWSEDDHAGAQRGAEDWAARAARPPRRRCRRSGGSGLAQGAEAPGLGTLVEDGARVAAEAGRSDERGDDDEKGEKKGHGVHGSSHRLPKSAARDANRLRELKDEPMADGDRQGTVTPRSGRGSAPAGRGAPRHRPPGRRAPRPPGSRRPPAWGR